MRRVAMLGLVLALAGCAGDSERIYGENWGGPSAAGPINLWPQAALDAQVSGFVLVACVVGEDHKLRDCRAVVESPAGWGFGESAVRMQADVSVPPEARKGQATLVSVPFCFNEATCRVQAAASLEAKDRYLAQWRQESPLT